MSRMAGATGRAFFDGQTSRRESETGVFNNAWEIVLIGSWELRSRARSSCRKAKQRRNLDVGGFAKSVLDRSGRALTRVFK
jgi:hypothetical protein